VLVSDTMRTDSDTVGSTLAVMTQTCQPLYVNCKTMFEMVMIINGCINTYILFMRRWISFGWLGNYGATFRKMHSVQGKEILWPVTYFYKGDWPCGTVCDRVGGGSNLV